MIVTKKGDDDEDNENIIQAVSVVGRETGYNGSEHGHYAGVSLSPSSVISRQM